MVYQNYVIFDGVASTPKDGKREEIRSITQDVPRMSWLGREGRAKKHAQQEKNRVKGFRVRASGACVFDARLDFTSPLLSPSSHPEALPIDWLLAGIESPQLPSRGISKAFIQQLAFRQLHTNGLEEAVLYHPKDKLQTCNRGTRLKLSRSAPKTYRLDSRRRKSRQAQRGSN